MGRSPVISVVEGMPRAEEIAREAIQVRIEDGREMYES
jgi:hypothetical protein